MCANTRRNFYFTCCSMTLAAAVESCFITTDCFQMSRFLYICCTFWVWHIYVCQGSTYIILHIYMFIYIYIITKSSSFIPLEQAIKVDKVDIHVLQYYTLPSVQFIVLFRLYDLNNFVSFSYSFSSSSINTLYCYIYGIIVFYLSILTKLVFSFANNSIRFSCSYVSQQQATFFGKASLSIAFCFCSNF